MKTPKTVLVEAHVRLFAEDVATLKAIAAEHAIPWHLELRLLVRRALKGRDLEIIKERP